MPTARVRDIEIYYEIHGESHPQTLVMVRGLGSDSCAWYEQTGESARQLKTVIFDNRGTGRTSKPDIPYTIAGMAEDTAGLMNALSIRRAALLGISMGGMIAQEFALRYPEKLSCLILGCTVCGGPEVVQPEREMIAALLAGPDAQGEMLKTQQRGMFCDETLAHRPEVVRKYYEARNRFPTPPHGLARQAAAAMSFDASNRISKIAVPTMVITGTEDRMVPPQNSELIAQRIPGAILKKLPGGHLFMDEYPELFNRAVIDFVKSHP